LLGVVPFLGALALVGCDPPRSGAQLDPAGPPAIKQIVVYDSTLTWGVAYGVHPEYNKCFDDLSDFAPCPTNYRCETVGPLANHCVHETNGTQPLAMITPSNRAGVYNLLVAGNAFQAQHYGPQVRLVIKELLLGATLESFVCDCAQSPAPGVAASCPPGQDLSPDPFDCSQCGENPNSTDIAEAGKCLDADFNGVPDETVLIANTATVTCGSMFSWTSAATRKLIFTTTGFTPTPNGGFWDPGGSQLLPAAELFEGLGPAIHLYIPGPLPSNTDCNVRLSQNVRDKDNQSFVDDPSVVFKTEPLSPLFVVWFNFIPNPMPPPAFNYQESDRLTNVPTDAFFTVLFNAPIMDVVPTDVELIDTVTGLAVPDWEPSRYDLDAYNGLAVGAVRDIIDIGDMTNGAPLLPNRQYRLTVKTTIRDSFGVNMVSPIVVTFTTGN
jgi:hypothetical protein